MPARRETHGDVFSEHRCQPGGVRAALVVPVKERLDKVANLGQRRSHGDLVAPAVQPRAARDEPPTSDPSRGEAQSPPAQPGMGGSTSASASATSRTSTPRTRHKSTDARSSTTKLTYGLRVTLRYFRDLPVAYPPMTICPESGSSLKPTGL